MFMKPLNNTFMLKFHDETNKNFKLLWKNLKNKNRIFHHQYQRQVKTCIFLYLLHDWFYFEFVFIYSISLMYKYLPELIKTRSKVKEKKHFMWLRFKFWPMKIIFPKLQATKLIMVCLQIYQEQPLLATFCQVHSNSKEVSYLPWQNKYPNLKTTCHIKSKFSLWTKLPKSLLLIKYLISVTTTLRTLLTTAEL